MVLMQGPLLKWTNMMKGYQQRWFVLDEINGLLSYYTVCIFFNFFFNDYTMTID